MPHPLHHSPFIICSFNLGFAMQNTSHFLYPEDLCNSRLVIYFINECQGKQMLFIESFRNLLSALRKACNISFLSTLSSTHKAEYRRFQSNRNQCLYQVWLSLRNLSRFRHPLLLLPATPSWGSYLQFRL